MRRTQRGQWGLLGSTDPFSPLFSTGTLAVEGVVSAAETRTLQSGSNFPVACEAMMQSVG
jgi:hypothetical protein